MSGSLCRSRPEPSSSNGNVCQPGRPGRRPAPFLRWRARLPARRRERRRRLQSRYRNAARDRADRSREAGPRLGRLAAVVQRIRDFAEGLRRGLGITVECRHCGKRAIYLCRDFEGYIDPTKDVEDVVRRCAWCRQVAKWVRFTMIDDINREALAQWRPPPWMKRR